MSMITVDGVQIKDPSSFIWGLQDISDTDSGRTTDGIMHKNRIAQKRMISLSWALCNKQEISAIMKAFNPEYIDVKYWDALDGIEVTRKFYVGDRSAPVKWWAKGREMFAKIAFDIIER